MNRLFFLTILMMLTWCGWSHPMPNTLISMNVSDKISMNIEIPLDEFEIAYGNSINDINEDNAALNTYIMRHLQFNDMKGRHLTYFLKNIKVDVDSNAFNGVYKELNLQIVLMANDKSDLRRFEMKYDIVIHKILTHEALVNIVSDYDTGKIEGTYLIGNISYNHNSKTVMPIKIDLGNVDPYLGFKSMFQYGMHHIYEGLDHLLFLIFLLITGPMTYRNKSWTHESDLRKILLKVFKIITAFTIGHSLTLLIGTLGYNIFPSFIIEIIIALSVLLTVINSVYSIIGGKEMVIALVFGCVHGLAFSNILLDLDLDVSRLIKSLLAFNLGIEAMQMIVTLLFIPFLIILSKHALYTYFRYKVAIAGVIISSGWLWQRTFGGDNLVSQWVDLQPKIIFYFGLYLIFLTMISIFYPGKFRYIKALKE